MADHPACVNARSDEQAREGAQIFRDYLLGDTAQEMAAAHGLRPVSDAAGAREALAALEAPYGLDLAQPNTVFAAPSTDAIYAVQDLWQSARKNVNLVMVIDVSGSMSGPKIESVRRSAVQFIEQMAEDDYLSIISFSSQPQALIQYQRVGDQRQAMIDTVLGLQAEGDTSLYDAIADGADLIRNTETPDTSSALVLLTDGLDTSSFRHNQESASQTLAETGATVFTIAFGDDADEPLLQRIALRANGNFFLGDEASIAAIYDEMSAAFGGIVGVGR
jgi:Ca-activated chloride channel family protein